MMGCCNYVAQHGLLVASLAAAALGFALGWTVKTSVPLSVLDQFPHYIDFLEEIQPRFIQPIAMFAIVTSIISGVSCLSLDTSSKIAVLAKVYFFFTTCMSVSIGLILVLLFKPGVVYTAGPGEAEDVEHFCTSHGILDLLRNIFPGNLVQASVQKYKTKTQEFTGHAIDPNTSHEMNATEFLYVGGYVDETNILGLIMCSFVVGLSLRKIEERGKILVDIFTCFYKMKKYFVNLVLCYLPFGVLFLIADLVVEVHDWDIAYSLGKFMAVVVIGLIIHAVIVLPMVYALLVRRNPWAVIKGVSSALLATVCNSSSSATLQLTSQCCEERNGISHRITSFMLPFGTNVNLDGTALYEVMAAVFICQLNNINVDLSQVITIGVTAAVSSTGTVGLPATGAVTTFFILTAVSLLAREASILVVVEWLLNRFNTVVNVLGNCIGVALVHHLSRNELEEMEEQNMDMDGCHPGPSQQLF